MIETTMNALREGSFDAEVTQRDYDHGGETKRAFVLYVESDPRPEASFHSSRACVTMTRAQAQQVYDAFTRAFTKYDGLD